MKWIVWCCLGLSALVRGSYSSRADEMAETTQLCCNRGATYARNHTSEECSSSVPLDVPPALSTLCIFAMDQCCKEYFERKRDCKAGVEIATSTNGCKGASSESKKCCHLCVRGIETGSVGAACTMNTHGAGPDDLAEGAFKQCCENANNARKKAETEPKPDHSVTVSKKPAESDPYSICEDFAPNELCAHHCIPIPGSYRCECNPGFKLMADKRNCMEITKNRCKPHNPCQHKCNDNGVDVKCSCLRGYKLMPDGKSCEDIDECSADTPVCLPNTECHNVQGSYKCIPIKHPKTEPEKGQCPPGFTRNFKNNACDDVNECKLPNPPCPFYLCENTIGGYKCGGVSGDPTNLMNRPRPPVEDRCPPGYKSGINDECEDVDECATNKDDCNKMSQFCINTRGSFYCQEKVSKHCPPGFKASRDTNRCEDIDECEDAEDICRSDQICVNVPGGYDCRSKESRNSKTPRCPDGMREDPSTGNCEDIDECAEGTHICDQYQNCLNTNGSHECNCKIGFELDPTTGACVDINECATDQNNCISASQRCDNTVGSYLCIRFISCGTGYILHHLTSTCEDVDECTLGTHNCNRAGPDFQCVNIPGSFRCRRVPPPQTPPAPASTPEYYDEYYDSEEEIAENKTVLQTTVKAVTITTTTTKPETTTETTPAPTTKSTPVPSKEPERPVDENPIYAPDIDNNIIDRYNPPEPAFPIAPEPPPIPAKPSEPETTYRPDTSPTSPKLVDVTVGEETATVQGEKGRDGSVMVDVENIPNNEWTKINEKPDCERGFEPGSFGECVDIDECATNRHVCSGLTEICRNTMGGYVCDCVPGLRRDLATGACGFVRPAAPRTFTAPAQTPPPISSTPFPPTTPSTTPPPPPTAPPPPRTTPPPPPTTPPPPPTTPPPPPTTPPPPPTTPPPPPTTPPPPPTSTSTTPPPTTPPTTPVPSTSSTSRNTYWNYDGYKVVPSRKFKPINSCDVGYHLNVNTGICEDVNECTNGQANCASVEVCVNTDGGYRCDCRPGWRLDRARHRCVPLGTQGRFPPGYGNEPSYKPVYPNEIHEQGVKGRQFVPPDLTAAVAKCAGGYRLGRGNTCEDVNECSTGEAECGPVQVCTNLPGGYTCSCAPGYRLVGDHECEDIDECSLPGGAPVCSMNADCINTMGSYRCRCHEGFRPAPVNDKVCVDLDECAEARAGSLCEQRCNNVWGGYRCSCHRGYRLNPDNTTCSDVDECTAYKSKRPCRGRCVNEPGGYRCTCPPGYRLSVDNQSCIDIDECETGEAKCGKGQYKESSEVCVNTRGGYHCKHISCPAGYRLESKHRCTKIESLCSPSDWECTHQASTISYNFITFVSNLEIPPQPDGAVDLFTMLGPQWPYASMQFNLALVSVDAPPGVRKATLADFKLKPNQPSNRGVTALVSPLEGPQSIELEMSMTLFSRGVFGGKAVARIFIYVSEYEF